MTKRTTKPNLNPISALVLAAMNPTAIPAVPAHATAADCKRTLVNFVRGTQDLSPLDQALTCALLDTLDEVRGGGPSSYLYLALMKINVDIDHYNRILAGLVKRGWVRDVGYWITITEAGITANGHIKALLSALAPITMLGKGKLS